MNYNPKEIEKKWQKKWLKEKTFAADDASKKPKYYALVEFPYPSGDGLHVGHVRSYTAMDIIARKRRMEGMNVLYPIGWDAFGLPTENYAIKTGIHPTEVTKKNTETFRRQLQSLGFSFDWDREINTTDPEYYKWTQWIFLQFFKKGLAYKAKVPINWCPKDKIGLANEEVVGGKCERCGTPVEEREKEQWMLKITTYADTLLEGLKEVDFLPEIKAQQENWIGRSEGAEIDFEVSAMKRAEKRNAIVIHGVSGHSKENWFPWFKNDLEKKGWNVFIPNLPNPDHPEIQKWNVALFEFKNSLNQDSVVIGHSLGVPAALSLIQKLEKKIDKLILVAPVNPQQDWNRLKKDTPALDWDAVRSFAENEFDWKKITSLVNEIIFYYSDNDKYIPAPSVDFYRKHLPSARFNLLLGKGHFNASSGVMEFSEILEDISPRIKIFTTRPDTLFGATYLVLAPENSVIGNWKSVIGNWKEVEHYIETAKNKTDLMRQEGAKEKSGVELKGIKAINPATKEEIPIWVADYVLGSYGTGAIMAVPAHDERDFEFAKKYKLPIKQVIAPETGARREKEEWRDGGCGVVFDPKQQKYAVARWNDGRLLFFAGGRNKGEEERTGVLREVTEESGFYDFEHVECIRKTHAHFHNHVKDVNRVTIAACYLVVLKSVQTKPLQLETHEQFEVVWTSAEDLLANLEKFNHERNHEHYIDFLKQAVGRAIDLGYDTMSNASIFTRSAYVGNGTLIDSGKFDGMDSETAKWEITKAVGGEKKVQYKLRDWVFSRQRYWGEPIPLVRCEKCAKWVAIPEKDLPIELPAVKKYEPRDDGESPLASVTKWVETKCPECGSRARRETDVMPNWAGSSWYFLAYLFNKRGFKEPASSENWKLQIENFRHFMPVDWYNGGMEHVTLHLLYSRFWNQFLHDEGYVPVSEPYKKRTAHGFILGNGGVKMSKSKGNVVNPDDLVEEFGADALRLYEMFIGPFDQAATWNPQGILGTERFLKKVWVLGNRRLIATNDQRQKAKDKNGNNKELERLLHKTIKKVGEDIEGFRFNTAVSALMIFVNACEKEEKLSSAVWSDFLKLLHPFAPHIAEELYEMSGNKNSLAFEPWPTWDEALTKDEEVVIAIQINGKVRDTMKVARGLEKNELERLALVHPTAKKWIEGRVVARVIVIPNRLVNIVLND